jgi:hypothetical protein
MKCSAVSRKHLEVKYLARYTFYTISLWPLLLEVVRERINIDLANNDGLDFIQAAKNRRTDPNSELVDHEKIAKVKARGIAYTITALGRLVETGVIKEAVRNKILINRFETALWIERTGRKAEWKARADNSHSKRVSLLCADIRRRLSSRDPFADVN